MIFNFKLQKLPHFTALFTYKKQNNCIKFIYNVSSRYCLMSVFSQRANYFCPSDENNDLHHYALNAPYYTHFTSPIRRYADVMVHRLLAASLDLAPKPTWTNLDTKR